MSVTSGLQVSDVGLRGLGLLHDVHLVVQDQVLFRHGPRFGCEYNDVAVASQLRTVTLWSHRDSDLLFRCLSEQDFADIQFGASGRVVALVAVDAHFSGEDGAEVAELADSIQADEVVTDWTRGCRWSALVCSDCGLCLPSGRREVGSGITGQSV